MWQLCAVAQTLALGRDARFGARGRFQIHSLATDSHQFGHFATVNLAPSRFSAPRQDTLLHAIVHRFLCAPIQVRIESCHLSGGVTDHLRDRSHLHGHRPRTHSICQGRNVSSGTLYPSSVVLDGCLGGCDGRIESFPRILHLPAIGASVCSVPDGENIVVETCAARRGEHARRVQLKRGLVYLDGDRHGMLCHCRRSRSNSNPCKCPLLRCNCNVPPCACHSPRRKRSRCP